VKFKLPAMPVAPLALRSAPMHRREPVEVLNGQTIGACGCQREFFVPHSRLPSSCNVSMPAAWQLPPPTDSNLTSAAFNAPPQHLSLPNDRPCVGRCEGAPVRDEKRRQMALVAVRMRPPRHAPTRQMRPTRSRASSITPIQPGISAFGIKVQKSQPISRRPANCKRQMTSRRSRNLSVDK
jgi:hypothetical protein